MRENTSIIWSFEFPIKEFFWYLFPLSAKACLWEWEPLIQDQSSYKTFVCWTKFPIKNNEIQLGTIHICRQRKLCKYLTPCPTTSEIFQLLWTWASNFKRATLHPPFQKTMEQQPHCAYERTKSKEKQNQIT